MYFFLTQQLHCYSYTILWLPLVQMVTKVPTIYKVIPQLSALFFKQGQEVKCSLFFFTLTSIFVGSFNSGRYREIILVDAVI